MGKLGIIQSFVRRVRGGVPVSDVAVDAGGGFIITAEHFSAIGDDAHPLAEDYVALMSNTGAGRESAIGYLDPVNTPTAGPGEKRIYSRDASSGVTAAEIWLKSDGSIVASNGSGSFALAAGGVVTINGVTIDTSGNITTGGNIGAASVAAPLIQADGNELAGHLHLAGTPPGNTGPNL